MITAEKAIWWPTLWLSQPMTIMGRLHYAHKLRTTCVSCVVGIMEVFTFFCVTLLTSFWNVLSLLLCCCCFFSRLIRFSHFSLQHLASRSFCICLSTCTILSPTGGCILLHLVHLKTCKWWDHWPKIGYSLWQLCNTQVLFLMSGKSSILKKRNMHLFCCSRIFGKAFGSICHSVALQS